VIAAGLASELELQALAAELEDFARNLSTLISFPLEALDMTYKLTPC